MKTRLPPTKAAKSGLLCGHSLTGRAAPWTVKAKLVRPEYRRGGERADRGLADCLDLFGVNFAEMLNSPRNPAPRKPTEDMAT